VSSTPFSWRCLPNGIAIIITVCGQIDMFSAPEFREVLTDIINKGSKYLIVNMTEITFIDSSGLGVLLSILRTVRPMGGTIALCGCDPTIMRTMTATRIDTIIPVRKTLDEVMALLPAIDDTVGDEI